MSTLHLLSYIESEGQKLTYLRERKTGSVNVFWCDCAQRSVPKNSQSYWFRSQVLPIHLAAARKSAPSTSFEPPTSTAGVFRKLLLISPLDTPDVLAPSALSAGGASSVGAATGRFTRDRPFLVLPAAAEV